MQKGKGNVSDNRENETFQNFNIGSICYKHRGTGYLVPRTFSYELFS